MFLNTQILRKCHTNRIKGAMITSDNVCLYLPETMASTLQIVFQRHEEMLYFKCDQNENGFQILAL